MNDDNQINHLKAYGIVYYSLEVGLKAKWLLNYDGGAFLIENNKIIEKRVIFINLFYSIVGVRQISYFLTSIIIFTKLKRHINH